MNKFVAGALFKAGWRLYGARYRATQSFTLENESIVMYVGKIFYDGFEEDLFLCSKKLFSVTKVWSGNWGEQFFTEVCDK